MSDLDYKENYLSDEEQYNKILNQNEIARIKDYELQSIRSKYWHLKHKVFLDEHGVPDSELETKWNELSEKEQEEINEYRRRRGLI